MHARLGGCVGACAGTIRSHRRDLFTKVPGLRHDSLHDAYADDTTLFAANEAEILELFQRMESEMSFLLASTLRKCLHSIFRRRYSSITTLNPPLVFSEEVLQAKSEGKPIVALESTIMTHGMPYPQNLQTAQEVENIIRRVGATPATIAILKGQLTVGLTQQQLQYLAQAKGVVKTSRRDLAPVMAGCQDGATTVAGTIIASELADIDVFVTGGIGGVHREGELTMDVSADLTELGRSRTLVVCSGVKSILDIGRTLEYLETHGVTVCAFGATDDFPAFYTTRSGHRAPHRAADAPHAARILHAARQLRLQSGIVVAVPVPQEHAMEENVIEDSIQQALKNAKRAGIQGKEVTPYILAAVAKATGGASLSTNIALIKNNAKVGADIAVEFQKLKNVNNVRNSFNSGSSGNLGTRQFHTACNLRVEKSDRGEKVGSCIKNENLTNPVLVIGGANVDRTYRVTEDLVQSSNSERVCRRWSRRTRAPARRVHAAPSRGSVSKPAAGNERHRRPNRRSK
ncbi:Pseudouridine-5'-phosphate glycosidase [Papilio machaon]|uniref:Pseudouridine-5'-phosphate glycosidase n=1 Tax=Papilio machaon TaxID=76193 RepID=A0A194R704_PAPMA|nr:Pseudouridine-5'-phosphate glycosidase [Papilio machaon]